MAGKQKKRAGEKKEEMPRVLKSIYINSDNSADESTVINTLNNIVSIKGCFSGKSLIIDILKKYLPKEEALARAEQKARSKAG